MRRRQFKDARFRNAAALVALLVAAVAALGPTRAAAQDHPTFARDVAPIIQQNCQICHQPGSIAPMSLNSFEAVKRYAPRIREQVATRIMPPWHIDRTVGIQEFKNDRGLTDEELETLVTWLDGDMPFGDEGDMPPPPEFPDGSEWQYAERFGPPDLVVRSEPYTLAAETQDKWFRPETPTGVPVVHTRRVGGLGQPARAPIVGPRPGPGHARRVRCRGADGDRRVRVRGGRVTVRPDDGAAQDRSASGSTSDR